MKLSTLLEAAAPSLDANDYPIAKASIAHQRTVTRFEEAVGIIDACVEANEIVNTVYEDKVKRFVNDFVEAAFNKVSVDHLYNGRYKLQTDELNDVNIPRTAREIPGFLKKLAKFSPESKAMQMYKDGLALANELLPLAEADAWLKAHMVKASDKKRQVAAVKAAEKDEFNAKHTSHADSKKVIDLLKKTASNIEDDIYENQLSGLKRMVKVYLEQSKEKGTTDYHELFKRDAHYIALLQSITERDRAKSTEKFTYKLEDGYETKLEAMAKRTAADIVNHFVNKNAGKLSYILYTKNNLEKVTIHNVNVRQGAVECDIKCEFGDGSSFVANSSVVYHYSSLGNLYYRYPTLFQNVVMPDNSRMSAPNEQKMQEVFAIAKD